MGIRKIVGKAAAASVALMVASAGMAAAHHCYKNDWAEAAYQQHLKGGTPWMPLSDLGTSFIIPPELQGPCGHVADAAVDEFMQLEGLTQEPLIHIKATVGSGAYMKGNQPKPFSYLDDRQFDVATMLLLGHLQECVDDLED